MYAPRKDDNHKSLVDTIIKVGGQVIDISALGRGVPDLIVNTRKGIQLAEVKNPKTDYGKAGASKSQKKWASNWQSRVYIIRTDEDAINLVMGKFDLLQGIGGFQ